MCFLPFCINIHTYFLSHLEPNEYNEYLSTVPSRAGVSPLPFQPEERTGNPPETSGWPRDPGLREASREAYDLKESGALEPGDNGELEGL